MKDYTGSRNPGTTIVLFHFHEAFELCRSRIALLRRLNAGLQIFGLYGGEPASFVDTRTLEACGVEHVHYDPEKTPAWNKKNTDLAVAGWYRSVGRSIPFDRVHVVQWDILFFAPLHRVYPRIPECAVAFTGLVPLAQIAHFWDWMTYPSLAVNSQRLLAEVRDRFGYNSEPHACIGPGYSLSRRFLDLYSDLDVDDTGHDELRLPLFAQILGFDLVDTGFYPRWMDPEVESVFNADAKEIDPALLESELAREGGRRVFHPCRERFDAATIERLLGRVCDAEVS